MTQNKRLKVTSVNCADLACPESPLNLSHPQTIQSPPQSVSPPAGPVETFEISSNKPNYTYTDLITLALRDKTSLTVSEIYQWIRSGNHSSPRSGENKNFDFPVKISHTFVRTMTGGRTVSATI